MTKRKNKPTSIRQKEFRGQVIDPRIFFADGTAQPEPLAKLIDAYQIHTWAYASVFAIATNFASINYEVLKQKEDGSTEANLAHPFNKLLTMPNPYMTPLDMKEFTAISLEMTGNAYWGLERNNKGEVVEAWILPSTYVRPVASSKAMVDYYIYEINGKRIIYKYEDMIHFQYSNPNDYIVGQGSIQAAKEVLTTDLFAIMWNKSFFKNSARPDSVLESENSLTEENKRRLLSSWRQLYSGAKNARKVAILDSGIHYKPIEHSHSDMEFAEGRKVAREEILAVFGVPPSIVGVLEFSNYANMKEQSKMFWMHTLIPKIRKFEATLTLRAQQIYFDPTLTIMADLSVVEALRTDELQRSRVAMNYWQMGVPFNSLVDSLSLPFEHIEGGDVPHPRTSTTFEMSDEMPEPSKVALFRKKEHTGEFRTELWKAFSRDISLRMNRMERSVRSFFNGQASRVLDAFKKNADAIIGNRMQKQGASAINIDLIFDSEKEFKLFAKVADNPIRGTFFDFAVKVSGRIKPDFDFNLQDPKALAWIEKKVTKIVKEANGFTQESLSTKIVKEIERGLAEGFSRSETIREIEKRIEEIYDFAVEGRAERIARTEIISASNKGSIEGMSVTGVEKKEWLATKDDKTRESHEEIDGQVVAIGDSFIVGNSKMDFPGDPDALPEEIVNCRCTILPVIENA